MKNILLLFLMVICLQLQAQTSNRSITVSEDTQDKTGIQNTYALVVGVSKYKNPDMPQLDFADDDAQFLYNFLVDENGMNVPAGNVVLLKDSVATWSRIWNEFVKLIQASKKNDRFIFYFSGHGDAYNAEDSYLLGYDAPAGDKNLYLGNALPIYQIKSRIKEAEQKGVDVLMITDACRTNEVPGGNTGAQTALKQVIETDNGEMQFISCSSNEFSTESSRWGNGHGVFTYYLVAGLYGLADIAPIDGNVTAGELDWYVYSNVHQQTQLKNNPSMSTQNPVFKGDNAAKGKILSVVNPEMKTEISDLVNKNKDFEGKGHKGMQVFQFESEQARNLFSEFEDAIDAKQLIGSDRNAAVTLLNQIKDNSRDNALLSYCNEELTNALYQHAQDLIDAYLNGNDVSNANKNMWFNAATEMQLALQNTSPSYFNYNQMKSKYYFLMARGYREGDNISNWNEGLLLIDSAIQLQDNAAYLYNAKGLICDQLGMDDEAMQCYKKANELAPKWLFPINNLGTLYEDKNQNDSALICYRKVIKLYPKNARGYAVLGSYFEGQKQNDSAEIYLHKASAMDSTSGIGNYNYAYFLHANHRNVEAIAILRKTIKNIPSYKYAYNLLGEIFLMDQKTDSAEKYFRLAIAQDEFFDAAITNLADLLSNMKNYSEADSWYVKLISMNPQSADGFYGLGNDLYIQNDYASAYYYFYKLIELDSTFAAYYNNLGYCFYYQNKYDSAAYWFSKAFKKDSVNDKALDLYAESLLNSGNASAAVHIYEIYLAKNTEAVTYNECLNIGYSYLYNHQFDKAIEWFKNPLLAETPDEMNYDLACVYSLKGDTDAAIAALKTAVKNGFADHDRMKDDSDLTSLHSNKNFNKILSKLE